MKVVVIGESSGATMETIMNVYPGHKVVVDKYIAKGEVIGIGPFSDKCNMAIFRTRAQRLPRIVFNELKNAFNNFHTGSDKDSFFYCCTELFSFNQHL